MLAFLAVTAAGHVTYVAADDQIEVTEVQCEAIPVSNGIKLTAPSRTNFEIYSITGQRVKSVSVDSGTVKVELPKGCYIVRCPQWSKKVVVK